MLKKNLVGILLLLVAAAAGLAVPLGAADSPAVAIPAPALASPPAAAPAGPEKGSGGETELPDVFTPKPNFVCLSGWCSSNTQCEQWFGPGSVCVKQKGATCGHCVDV